jgi:hypothetical protein
VTLSESSRGGYIEGLVTGLPSSLRRWCSENEVRSAVSVEFDATVRQRMQSLEHAEEYALHFPVAGRVAADYQLREVSVCGGAARVLAGIHFKGLRLTRPFIGVFAQTNLLGPDETVAASLELGATFAAFSPLGVRWWSPEQHDLRAARGCVSDQRLLVAPLGELGVPPPLPAGLALSPDRTGDSYSEYAGLFEEFWRERPSWRGELPVTPEDEYRRCAQQGRLIAVEYGGRIAGIFAARLGTVFGLRGWEMLDEILGQHLRGRGLAPALQRHFLATLDPAQAPLIWGTIGEGNTPSWRTAVRAGRKDVGGWIFLPTDQSCDGSALRALGGLLAAE